MAETAATQIDFAQPVKEKQSGLNPRVLEFAADEFDGRERAGLEQQPSVFRAFEQGAPFLERQRRSLRFGRQNISDNRLETLTPTPQRRSVFRTELREGRRGLFEIRPPFQDTVVPADQRHVQRGFDVISAVSLKFEVAIPRQVGQAAVIERMRVMDEAGARGPFHGRQAAAGHVPRLEANRGQARPRQVGLKNQAVVPGAENDAVVGFVHGFRCRRECKPKRTQTVAEIFGARIALSACGA